MLDSPLKLKLYFLRNLPMAFLAGLRIVSYNSNQATVSLPYKYLTKNPFRSIYFACQAMAAEFSTAVLCLQELARHEADVSLIVVHVEGTFTQKAEGRVSFSCEDNGTLGRAISESIAMDEARTVTLNSIGKNSDNETVAEFTITWSFKPRK